VVETTSPVDGNVGSAGVELLAGSKRSTGRDCAELEDTLECGTVLAGKT